MDEVTKKDTDMWLAQYDFRTKQKYIFRTNKIKEIVGASALITCMYDLFIDECIKNKINIDKSYEFPMKSRFEVEKGWQYTIDHFIDLKYKNSDSGEFEPKFDNDIVGKVLYVGGGNLYILWKDKQTALNANKLLCDLLRREAYSLFPACGLVKYSGNYSEDIHNLSEAFNRSKEELTPFTPMAVLPFTRIDRQTSFPVAKYVSNADGSQEYLPKESWLKRNVNDIRINVKNNMDPLGVTELDDMVEKGVNSLLAVIHIDGNNMGERVSRTMSAEPGKPLSDYSEAVKRIRVFSNSIQEHLVTKPLEEISKWLTEHQKRARIIVAGGDDVTLVCSAKIAFELLEVYFKTLKDNNEGKDPEDIDTSCAGVCIFHSHSPFATAYEIAESCCEEAKLINRQNGGKNMLMDFQYCFSGVTGDLASMREEDKKLMGRPYSFWFDKPNDLNTAEKLRDYATKACQDIGRGNIKQLSSMLLMNRPQEFQMEIQRLKTIVHTKEAKEFLDSLSEEASQKYLFDISQVFDLWFSEVTL